MFLRVPFLISFAEIASCFGVGGQSELGRLFGKKWNVRENVKVGENVKAEE